MLDVKGFRGFRFDQEKVGNLDFVVTPPYDVISPSERQMLAGKSPYSMANVILPEPRGTTTRYQAAAEDVEEWIASGILKQDDTESFYLLEQVFQDTAGETHVRRGFLGVIKAPEDGENTVLGHERTFEGTVEDRILLTASTRANLGPVFVLYPDPQKCLEGFLAQMQTRPPDMVAHTIDGVTQRVWRVAHDPAVSEFFRDKRLYIADGHHRFRTACVYRDQRRTAEGGDANHLKAYDYVLMGFVAMSDPGLLIYPTHRLAKAPANFVLAEALEALTPSFDVLKVEAANLPGLVEKTPGCVIGLATREGHYLLTLRTGDREQFLGSDRGPSWRDLDVAILHRGIIERLWQWSQEDAKFGYERDARTTVNIVERGEYTLGFILKATRADQIRACAEDAEPMPHKSTYFFPKLPTGAVINRLV